ncbi:Sterol O-acyltransferase 2 (Sterol-ester synthase 2) [Gnomoniopsis sp. IMI 355080]|nr:Sterol O-acyltransferase 2 (Sterol-ester synthase 2) [Gnomoniopsis sp. IMI 355080]
MTDLRTAAPADTNVHHGDDSTTSTPGDESYLEFTHAPHSLRDALRSANGGGATTPTDSTSEEDYDEQSKKPVAVLMRRRKETAKEHGQPSPLPRPGSSLKTAVMNSEPATPSDFGSEVDKLEAISVPKGAKLYAVAPNDKELRAILKRGMQRAKESVSSTNKRKGRFRDYVFTQKFSTFDMRNEVAATSPFHGFFTLFWLAVAIFMIKIGADNWKNTGSPLGTNDIMRNMFRRDVVVLLASDGVMCGITGVSWLLQLLILKGYIDWDGAGWILQNIWQTIFVFANIGWTQLREWPWSHTVFFVLHTLVMLMKQHSWAFYNGYLSTAYKKREELLKKLKQLDNMEVVKTPSSTEATASAISPDPEYLTRRRSVNEVRQRRRSLHSGQELFSKDLEEIEAALESNKPLDSDQIDVFKKIIQWEIDGLSEELMGKATSTDRAYPRNLTVKNHYEYIVLPTVVYELQYPRAESINWHYVFEKAAATVGVIFVMIMISQGFIYPVVMKTVAMREADMPLAERFAEFPWLLSDLIFPMLMEYLLSWYVIWEAILNLLGELTYFADREFYNDWWNSVSWDQFARDWNRPVHNFLLRHVYHSSISAMKVNKHTATLITFFLSALVHELVMWCIFKKLRGYLLVLQMFQLPLVRLSRTKWLKGRQTLGNVFFWLGIFTGPSILCSLYLVL